MDTFFRVNPDHRNDPFFFKIQKEGLRPGELMKGKVLERKGTKALIAYRDTSFWAELAGEFPTRGEVYLRVLGHKKGQLFLQYKDPGVSKEIGDAKIDEVLHQQEIQSTSTSRALVKTLLEYQLPLKKETLQDIISKLKGLEIDKPALRDSLSFLMKHELPVSRESLLALERFYSHNLEKILDSLEDTLKRREREYKTTIESKARTTSKSSEIIKSKQSPSDQGTISKDHRVMRSRGTKTTPRENLSVKGTPKEEGPSEALNKKTLHRVSTLRTPLPDVSIERRSRGTKTTPRENLTMKGTPKEEGPSEALNKKTLHRVSILRSPLPDVSIERRSRGTKTTPRENLTVKGTSREEGPSEALNKKTLHRVSILRSPLPDVRERPIVETLQDRGAEPKPVQEMSTLHKKESLLSLKEILDQLPLKPDKEEITPEKLKKTLEKIGLHHENSIKKKSPPSSSTLKGLLLEFQSTQEVERGELGEIKSLLEYITGKQLFNLGQDHLYLQIPIYHEKTWSTFELFLRRKSHYEGEEEEDLFSISLFLATTRLGEIGVRILLHKKELSLDFYTSLKETERRITNHREELQKYLQEKGLLVRRISMQPLETEERKKHFTRPEMKKGPSYYKHIDLKV